MIFLFCPPKRNCLNLHPIVDEFRVLVAVVPQYKGVAVAGADPDVETPNNFCLSRFSQVCSDLHFLQIANLDTHTCSDFLKFVYIFLHFLFMF